MNWSMIYLFHFMHVLFLYENLVNFPYKAKSKDSYETVHN